MRPCTPSLWISASIKTPSARQRGPSRKGWPPRPHAARPHPPRARLVASTRWQRRRRRARRSPRSGAAARPKLAVRVRHARSLLVYQCRNFTMTNEPTDPFVLARELLEQRQTTEPTDATAMTLATADASGRPSARMVLLKGIDDRGFVFFTNYESRKSMEIAANPFAALCIHWAKAAEQVRVEGRIERVSDAESDAYFETRPRGSQIGAWASRQSAPLPSREALLERVREIEARFEGGPVPRPPFWGGYRVVPERIEFWRGQESRLHDRVVYLRDGDGWRVERLYP
ncbi:pyridoxamine 5'-phosphate oxidase [Sorangium sp. So ce385]